MKFNQKKFIDQITKLIIINKDQIIISKDNILNKEQFCKIFPKIKDFKIIKNKNDPNNFYYSAYYNKIK